MYERIAAKEFATKPDNTTAVRNVCEFVTECSCHNPGLTHAICDVERSVGLRATLPRHGGSLCAMETSLRCAAVNRAPHVQ